MAPASRKRYVLSGAAIGVLATLIPIVIYEQGPNGSMFPIVYAPVLIGGALLGAGVGWLVHSTRGS